MRKIRLRMIATGLVIMMLGSTMSNSAAYSAGKKEELVVDEAKYATDEFRVDNNMIDDNGDLSEAMKYARNNKNEYLIVKKENTLTSVFKKDVKEIVGEKNLLAGNLLYKGQKKAEKYRKEVEKSKPKSGQIVYVDSSNKELRRLLNQKNASQKEVREKINALYNKQEKVRNEVWKNHNKDILDVKEDIVVKESAAPVIESEKLDTTLNGIDVKATPDSKMLRKVESTPTATPEIKEVSKTTPEIKKVETSIPSTKITASPTVEESTDEDTEEDPEEVLEASFDGPIVALVKAGKEKREKLQKLDSVELMIPNSYLTFYEDSSNNQSEQNVTENNNIPWGAMAVHADYAANNGVTGAGIRVGIIDTGIKDHPDMRIAGGYNFIDDNLNWEDIQGHGTKVAGIIHSQLDGVGLAGVAPGSELYALKVTDGFGRGTVAEVIEAIMWAVENNIDVLNMSFGVSEDIEALHEVIKYAHSQGVVMVAALANDGSISYPAAYDEVIAVGSMDNEYKAVKDNYSNNQVKAQYVAPGVNIFTTDNSNSYSYVSGTSFAAAHVTGVIANVWSKDNSKSANFVRELVKQSCKEITTKDTNIEFGMPDIKLALEQYAAYETGYDVSNDQVGEWEKPGVDYSNVSDEGLHLYESVGEIKYEQTSFMIANELNNETRIWRDKNEEVSSPYYDVSSNKWYYQTIRKNGAKSIRLHFSDIKIASTDAINILAPDTFVEAAEDVTKGSTSLSVDKNNISFVYTTGNPAESRVGFKVESVEYVPDDIPTEPDALNITSINSGYKLEWEASEDDDAVTYRVYVYYRTQSNATKKVKVYNGASDGITDLNNGKYKVEINSSDLGTTADPVCGVIEMYVEAIDVYGNNSYSEVEYLNTGKDDSGTYGKLSGISIPYESSSAYVEGNTINISGTVADIETLKITLGDEVLVKRYVKDAYKSDFSGSESFSFNYKLREAKPQQSLKIEMGVNGKSKITNISFPAVSAATPAPTPSIPELTDVQKYNLGNASEIEQFGNFSISRTDVENLFPGSEMSVGRTYNSMNTESGSLGIGWSLSVENSIKEETINGQTIATVSYGDGSKEKFTHTGGNDLYTSSLSRAEMYAMNTPMPKLSDGSQSYSIKRRLEYADGSKSYFIEKGNGEYVLAIEEDTFGNQVQYEYDSNYKVTSVISHRGKQFNLEYNSDGRLQSIEDSNGGVYKYRFDSSNRLVKVITPEGRPVYYDYTDNSLLKSETVNDDDEKDDVEWRKNFKVTYKTNGKVDTYTNEYNKEFEYFYNQSRDGIDDWTKVKSMFYSHGINSYYGSDEEKATTYEWSRFQASNLCQISSIISTVDDIADENINNTLETSATYNNYGEVLTETDKFGKVTTYLYDSNGNVVQITYPNGLNKYYKYNSANNLTFEGTFDVDNGIPVMPTADTKGDYSDEALKAISEIEATWYIYDNSGKYLLRSAEYIDGSALFTVDIPTNSADFSITTYEYYQANATNNELEVAGLFGVPYKMVEYTTNSGGTTSAETIVTYNENSIETKSGEITSTDTYDNMGNIVCTESSDGTIQKNEYDKDGNCLRTINYNLYKTTEDENAEKVENQTTVNRTVYNLSGTVIFELMGDVYNTSRDCLNNENPVDLYVYDISEYAVSVDTDEENIVVGSRSASIMSNNRASAGNDSYETDKLMHSYSFDSDDGVSQSVFNQNGETYWSRNYVVGEPNNNNRQFTNFDEFGRMIRIGENDHKINEYIYKTILPTTETGVVDSDDSARNITIPTDKVKTFTYTEGVANAAPAATFVAQNSSITYTDYMGYEYKTIQSNERKSGESAPSKYTVVENIMGKTGVAVKATSRVKKSTSIEETTSIATYDKAGRVVKEQTPISKSGNTTSYTIKRYKYDTSGNVLEEESEIQQPDNTVTYEIMRYDYDSNGNVIRERQVAGRGNNAEERIVEYIYDSENRNIRIVRGLTAPLADRSLAAVDVLGNSSVYKYEYDEQGRLVQETDYEGRRTEYSEFDDTNIARKIQKYTSNDVLYYTITQDNTNGTTISGGDENAEVKTKTDTVEGATGYESDTLIKTTVADGGYIVSKTRKVVDESKYEIISVYDSEGKLVVEIMNSVSDTGTKSVIYRKEYTYYASGAKHTFMIFDGSGNTLYGLRYQYEGNNVGAIDEIHDLTSAPDANDSNYVAYETYNYNGDGLLNQKTNNTFSTNYSYNLAGMVSSQYTIKVNGGIGTTPITASYNNYYNDGKVYQSGDSFISTYSTYEYNAYGDLAKETRNGTKITEYQHDSKYNLSYRKEYSTTDTAYTQTYYNVENNGDKNHMVYGLIFPAENSAPSETITNANTFDAMGNEISCASLGSAYDTTYDLESNLKTSAAGLITYYYSPDGMMYRRKGVANNGKVTFEDTQYIYDENGQLIIEINNLSDKMKKYVRGVDGQISKTIDENNNIINYYAYNTHGDVCRITDSTGTVTGTYVYDSYGNIKSNSGNNAGTNLMRYCGEYYDIYSGCYYLRARFYNPMTMRFKQADTYLGDIGDPASRNLYAYCGNDPMNYNDPTGHWGANIHREITEKAFNEANFGYRLEKVLKTTNLTVTGSYAFRANLFPGIRTGCTWPDQYRGSKRKKDPLFNKIFYDSNDQQFGGTGYWHGGDYNIYKAGKVNYEVDRAVKKIKTMGAFKGGVWLGCVLHAVQDKESHAQNSVLVKMQSEVKDNKTLKKYFHKEYSISFIKGILGDAYQNKRINKSAHGKLSDNPLMDFVNGRWEKRAAKSLNTRYMRSVFNSQDVMNIFLNKIRGIKL